MVLLGVLMLMLAVIIVVVMEVFVVILIVFGFFICLLVVLFIFYMLGMVVIGYYYWDMIGDVVGLNMINFWKNVSIVGVFLLLVIIGLGVIFFDWC